MAPAVETDRQNRFTLRFLDPSLEHLYQVSSALDTRQIGAGPAVAIGLWIAGGLLTPAVTHADPGPVYAIAGLMAGVNLVGVLAARWATTLARQQLLGFVLNVMAGIAVLAIAVVVGEFEQFAAPALMLIGVFAFIVLRLQFVLAALVTLIYIVAFAVAGLLAGAPGLALSLFLVSATVTVACGGTYVIEDGQRHRFVQERAITLLHAQLDRLFHQYLSPDVAAVLLAEGDRAELGGEIVDVTVLFADLAGFTPYSERTDPGQVVGLLNAYFGAAVPVIFGQGGTIVQFAGDAVMAVFNAPLRQPDHALRAARAALALQAAVAPVAAARLAAPRFRVGLNTGLALVGNIGSDEIRNFTAIGDTINLAARLQAFATPGHVVIGAATHDALGERALVRHLGSPELKGKSPVEVYELLGLQEPGQPVARPERDGSEASA